MTEQQTEAAISLIQREIARILDRSLPSLVNGMEDELYFHQYEELARRELGLYDGFVDAFITLQKAKMAHIAAQEEERRQRDLYRKTVMKVYEDLLAINEKHKEYSSLLKRRDFDFLKKQTTISEETKPKNPPPKAAPKKEELDDERIRQIMERMRLKEESQRAAQETRTKTPKTEKFIPSPIGTIEQRRVLNNVSNTKDDSNFSSMFRSANREYIMDSCVRPSLASSSGKGVSLTGSFLAEEDLNQSKEVLRIGIPSMPDFDDETELDEEIKMESIQSLTSARPTPAHAAPRSYVPPPTPSAVQGLPKRPVLSSSYGKLLFNSQH